MVNAKTHQPIHASTRGERLAPLTRRRFLSLAGGLCCAPLLDGCTQPAEPVSLSVHMWPGYEPISLARSLGWLDTTKVRLIEAATSADSIKLFEQGQVDAIGLTLDEVMRMREVGLPVSVILVCDISAGADMFLVKPGVKQLSDIKGLTIGVEDGALGTLMLYQILRRAGLEQKDVRLVKMTVDLHAEAWEKGVIDAAITFEPGASKIIQMGGLVAFDSRQIPDLIFDVIAIKTPVLNAVHETALRHMLEMHLKALTYIQTNSDDAAYRMAPRFNLPPELVMPTFRGLVLPDLNNNLRLLGGDEPEIVKSAGVVADTLIKAGILRQAPQWDDLVHPEYLPRQAT